MNDKTREVKSHVQSHGARELRFKSKKSEPESCCGVSLGPDGLQSFSAG